MVKLLKPDKLDFEPKSFRTHKKVHFILRGEAIKIMFSTYT